MAASPQLPFRDARVSGIRFTNDPNRALVEVELKVMVKDFSSGYMASTLTDTWVRIGNKWFLELSQGPLKAMFNPSLKPDAAAVVVAPTDDLAKSFSVSDAAIDLGVIPQGDRRRFLVHVSYTSEQPASLQVAFPTEAIVNEGTPAQLTRATKELSFIMVSEFWENDFAIPITLKATRSGVSVQRTVLVRGSVFAPITIVQNPSIFVDKPGNKLELRIRNNTEYPAMVVSISTDDAYSLAGLPEPIPPKSEQVIELLRKANDAEPRRVYFTFETPLTGRKLTTFSVRIRSER